MADGAVLPPFAAMLIVHGMIGGADVLLNHEFIARVPSLPNALPEQRLHCLRVAIFALLFGALAWGEWGGLLAWGIVALLLAELIVSTFDTVREVEIRILPVSERVLHVLLFVNLGIVIAQLAQVLPAWARGATEVRPVDYGWASWVMSAMAAAALLWSVRDGLNVLARKRGAL